MTRIEYTIDDIPIQFAKTALVAASGACNLSGLIHSAHNLTDLLWVMARAKSQGTDWVNQHPLMTLMLDQMIWLNAGDCINREKHEAAVMLCQLAIERSEQKEITDGLPRN